MISTTSTGLVAWSGPWSISVSRSRSSTRRPMRLASCLIRRIASSVLASSASPPAPWSAAYPFSVTSGVRSSWEASATNWRSRAWVASFVSTSWLNAVPRSWASVPTGNASTRWLVSPELIDRATLVTRRMGSRPSRRIHQNTSAMTASRTAPTISNVVRRPVSAASMSAIERPRTRVSPEGRAGGEDPHPLRLAAGRGDRGRRGRRVGRIEHRGQPGIGGGGVQRCQPVGRQETQVQVRHSTGPARLSRLPLGTGAAGDRRSGVDDLPAHPLVELTDEEALLDVEDQQARRATSRPAMIARPASIRARSDITAPGCCSPRRGRCGSASAR